MRTLCHVNDKTLIRYICSNFLTSQAWHSALEQNIEVCPSTVAQESSAQGTHSGCGHAPLPGPLDWWGRNPLLGLPVRTDRREDRKDPEPDEHDDDK